MGLEEVRRVVIFCFPASTTKAMELSLYRSNPKNFYVQHVSVATLESICTISVQQGCDLADLESIEQTPL